MTAPIKRAGCSTETGAPRITAGVCGQPCARHSSKAGTSVGARPGEAGASESTRVFVRSSKKIGQLRPVAHKSRTVGRLELPTAPAFGRSPMWIVRLALRRPYTFVVMSMLIVILGVVTLTRMETDIFPNIDIPVISVVWYYGGLSPDEMERRIVNNYERSLTTTVNDIEAHREPEPWPANRSSRSSFSPGRASTPPPRK